MSDGQGFLISYILRAVELALVVKSCIVPGAFTDVWDMEVCLLTYHGASAMVLRIFIRIFAWYLY